MNIGTKVFTNYTGFNKEGKRKAVKFEILWSEGMKRENVTFWSWGDIELQIAKIASRDIRKHGYDGGYTKTKYRITYADGETYTGRMDVNGQNTSLVEWMERFVKHSSGRHKPSWMSQEDYDQHMAMDYANPEMWGAFLDNYEIGEPR